MLSQKVLFIINLFNSSQIYPDLPKETNDKDDSDTKVDDGAEVDGVEVPKKVR